MKILVINQPLNNRGDEAAHRSLIRGLNKKFPNSTVTILLVNANQNSINQITVQSDQNKYINIHSFNRGSHFLKRWSLRLGLIKLSILHPLHRYISNYIKKTDLVVCAPGGICMGPFQDWNHIYNLTLAFSYHKKVAYYSRSFGPFPNKTKWNRVFKTASINLLEKFDFLSIRDFQTMQLADKLNISYIPSIDTAFLDSPKYELPNEIKGIIGAAEYVVFVPNELTWHPAFQNCNKEDLNSFYLKILDILLNRFKASNILMLPQIFNNPNINDQHYFKELKKLKENNTRLIVMPDSLSSDMQQTIIANAKLMIGARYHSIVFAINNKVPFVALSYEHKIAGILQLLGLEEYMINIENIGTDQFNSASAIKRINEIIAIAKPPKKANEKAIAIANECLNKFAGKYQE